MGRVDDTHWFVSDESIKIFQQDLATADAIAAIDAACSNSDEAIDAHSPSASSGGSGSIHGGSSSTTTSVAATGNYPDYILGRIVYIDHLVATSVSKRATPLGAERERDGERTRAQIDRSGQTQ